MLTGLEQCGLSRCPDGANATEPLFSRSAEDWVEATHRWTHHPESESALLLASIVADNRPVTHVELGSALTQSMLSSTRDRAFLSALLSFTLAVKPPRGLISDFTVAHTGPHRGQLDLKRGGLWPVVLLGRWMALAVGDPSGSTIDRIRRGSQSGLLTAGEAEDLIGAFEQIYQLRFDQEIAALKSGGLDRQLPRAPGHRPTAAALPARQPPRRLADPDRGPQGPGHRGGRAGWTWRSARDVCQALGPWALLTTASSAKTGGGQRVPVSAPRPSRRRSQP